MRTILHRFEREARSASALNHPNIVTIYELAHDGSTHYIAMELIEGQTLRQLLAAGSLPIRKAIEIAAQVAEGLAKAHEAGIAHRDLKPDNLMISSDGFVKILDFGLAKVAARVAEQQETRELSGWQTQPGVLVGTVQYMSPEQASGAPFDFRSDQFSFGLVLYEMVTGNARLPETPWPRRSSPSFANRPSRSPCKIPRRPLRCVGPSSGAWRKIPTSATFPREIWRANLRLYATASRKTGPAGGASPRQYSGAANCVRRARKGNRRRQRVAASPRCAPGHHYGHGRNRQDSPSACRSPSGSSEDFPGGIILFRSRRCAIPA